MSRSATAPARQRASARNGSPLDFALVVRGKARGFGSGCVVI